MASIWRASLLTGTVAAAIIATVPAQAKETLVKPLATKDSTETLFTPIESEVTAEVAEATSLETPSSLISESELETASETASADGDVSETTLSETTIEVNQLANQPLDIATFDSAELTFDGAATSAEAFFEATETAETSETAADEDGQKVAQLAQVTRPLYRGAAPFYVGIGGNIGAIESDESAVGDFSFTIISKISLGPRFSVRPLGSFSEDDVSVAIPLTYNFNPIDIADFNLYPSAGVGVDIGDEIGLLVNGGVDLPISRDFTLNGQINWRATSDTGLGISFGVGYNFPFFFE